MTKLNNQYRILIRSSNIDFAAGIRFIDHVSSLDHYNSSTQYQLIFRSCTFTDNGLVAITRGINASIKILDINSTNSCTGTDLSYLFEGTTYPTITFNPHFTSITSLAYAFKSASAIDLSIGSYISDGCSFNCMYVDSSIQSFKFWKTNAKELSLKGMFQNTNNLTSIDFTNVRLGKQVSDLNQLISNSNASHLFVNSSDCTISNTSADIHFKSITDDDSSYSTSIITHSTSNNVVDLTLDTSGYNNRTITDVAELISLLNSNSMTLTNYRIDIQSSVSLNDLPDGCSLTFKSCIFAGSSLKSLFNSCIHVTSLMIDDQCIIHESASALQNSSIKSFTCSIPITDASHLCDSSALESITLTSMTDIDASYMCANTNVESLTLPSITGSCDLNHLCSNCSKLLTLDISAVNGSITSVSNFIDGSSIKKLIIKANSLYRSGSTIGIRTSNGISIFDRKCTASIANSLATITFQDIDYDDEFTKYCLSHYEDNGNTITIHFKDRFNYRIEFINSKAYTELGIQGKNLVIDFDGIDFDGTDNLSFENTTELTSVSYSNIKNLTSMHSTYAGCTNLSSVTFSSISNSCIDTFDSAFMNTSITSIDLSLFTWHKSNLNHLFEGTPITSIVLPTSTDQSDHELRLNSTFKNTSIKNLDISDLELASCIDLTSFLDDTSLEQLTVRQSDVLLNNDYHSLILTGNGSWYQLNQIVDGFVSSDESSTYIVTFTSDSQERKTITSMEEFASMVAKQAVGTTEKNVYAVLIYNMKLSINDDYLSNYSHMLMNTYTFRFIDVEFDTLSTNVDGTNVNINTLYFLLHGTSNIKRVIIESTCKLIDAGGDYGLRNAFGNSKLEAVMFEPSITGTCSSFIDLCSNANRLNLPIMWSQINGGNMNGMYRSSGIRRFQMNAINASTSMDQMFQKTRCLKIVDFTNVDFNYVTSMTECFSESLIAELILPNGCFEHDTKLLKINFNGGSYEMNEHEILGIDSADSSTTFTLGLKSEMNTMKSPDDWISYCNSHMSNEMNAENEYVINANTVVFEIKYSDYAKLSDDEQKRQRDSFIPDYSKLTNAGSRFRFDFENCTFGQDAFKYLFYGNDVKATTVTVDTDSRLKGIRGGVDCEEVFMNTSIERLIMNGQMTPKTYDDDDVFESMFKGTKSLKSVKISRERHEYHLNMKSMYEGSGIESIILDNEWLDGYLVIDFDKAFWDSNVRRIDLSNIDDDVDIRNIDNAFNSDGMTLILSINRVASLSETGELSVYVSGSDTKTIDGKWFEVDNDGTKVTLMKHRVIQSIDEAREVMLNGLTGTTIIVNDATFVLKEILDSSDWNGYDLEFHDCDFVSVYDEEVNAIRSGLYYLCHGSQFSSISLDNGCRIYARVERNGLREVFANSLIQSIDFRAQVEYTADDAFEMFKGWTGVNAPALSVYRFSGTDMTGMFAESSIENFTMPHVDGTKLILRRMFENTTNLVNVDLSSLSLHEQVINANDIFAGSSVRTLILNEDDFEVDDGRVVLLLMNGWKQLLRMNVSNVSGGTITFE